jgi:hypothetical protein
VLKFRHFRAGDEIQIVHILNETYSNWGSVEDWRHKYLENANFDPMLVILGDDDGKIVSCVHYIRRDIWFNGRLLHSYVGGDGATLSKYANRGLFSRGLRRLYEEVKKRKGTVVYGYNTGAIYKSFYRKRFGEVAVFRPRVFLKVLDGKALIMQALPVMGRLAGMQHLLGKEKGITICLKIAGETATLSLSGRGVLSVVGKKPDIIVEVHSLAVLPYAFGGMFTFLSAFLLRKLRIKINGSSIFKLISISLKLVSAI